MKKTTTKLLACFGIALSLATGTVLGGGGATGTGYVAWGAVDDFGSIFVNGIEFFTDKATITLNGDKRPESDLRIGMVLTVNGSVNSNGTTGTAGTVTYVADAIGLVDRAPTFGPDGAEFGVLGQSVRTGARTVFANVIGVGSLQVGDFVEVSGFRTASGLLASRVERKPGFASVQVKGGIGNVTATTFSLGTLTVDYAIATRKNVPSGGLAAGMTVVAKGPTPSGGTLTATDIEVITPNLSGSTNGSNSGVVSGFNGSSITVNDQPIQLTSATAYANGTFADLADGKTVKVAFSIVGSTLVATKVEFTKLNAPVTVEATITSIAGATVELFGPDGVTLAFNADSQLQDKSDAKVKNLTVADMRVGDRLSVRGDQVDEAVVLVNRLDRTKPSSVVTVAARALSISAPQFTLLDTIVQTNASTSYINEFGAPITADVFFARASGHKISVTGTAVANVITATTARIE